MLRSDKLGTVLVDAKGDTLYTFSIPRCTGLCAQAWPPDYTKAVAGAGVVGRFGTVKRDGKEQVTYDGHALYTYAGDTKAGETRGNGLVAFGGTWWASTPSDVPLANRTSSGGGSGYAAASNVIAASSTPEGPDVMFHSGPQCEIHADGPC
jgi:predicted lipoprotein with Yx(FWY)xxD motif